MSPKTCLRVGITGSIVFALCCFTPLLSVVLGAIGLTVWLAWLDYVLVPALGVFLALAVYGFYAGQTTSMRSRDDAAPSD